MSAAVLDAWLVTELLTPQTVSSWVEFADKTHGRLLPQRELSAPMKPPGVGQAWQLVVLASIEAGDCFRALDRAFGASARDVEELQRADGHVIAATLLLDGKGCYQTGSLNLSGFAWGVARILENAGPAQLAGWEQAERRIQDELQRAIATGPAYMGQQGLVALAERLRVLLGVPADMWLAAPAVVGMERKLPPERPLLSSLLLPDLLRVRAALALASAAPGAALGKYLAGAPPSDRWDPLSDRSKLEELLQPCRFPLGCWPAPGRHPLSLYQLPWRVTHAGDSPTRR